MGPFKELQIWEQNWYFLASSAKSLAVSEGRAGLVGLGVTPGLHGQHILASSDSATKRKTTKAAIMTKANENDFMLFVFVKVKKYNN